MSVPLKIGLDLAGATASPVEIAQAAIEAREQIPTCHFHLIGPSDPLSDSKEGIFFHKTAQGISQEDSPLLAIRKKPDSSLVVGVKALAEKKLDAFLTLGNTGALIAAGTLLLPKLAFINRPALLANFPASHGRMVVLDVGGNLATRGKQLVQFAFLGSAFAQARYGIENPKVALLNIGAESQKGTKELRQAFQTLSYMADKPFTFIGNVEGRDVFLKGVDVLITNGFSGNIFLKTTEGIAEFVFHLVEEQLGYALSSETAKKTCSNLKVFFSPEASQGALLAGLDGILMKCHGNATKSAIIEALKGAYHFSANGLIEKMKSYLVSSQPKACSTSFWAKLSSISRGI